MDTVSDITDSDCQQLQWLLNNDYRIDISTPFGCMRPAKISTYLGKWCWYDDSADNATRFHFSLVSKKDIKVFEVSVTEITDWDDYSTYFTTDTA